MIEERIAELDRTLRLAHGGGLRLAALDAAGRATVRFTGMCTACPTRPMCFEHAIRPLLGNVEVVGMRWSDEAKAALRGH